MSEKRKFQIVACETKELQGGKKLYNCVGSDGVKYACWEGKVLEFVLKGEREFNVFSKQNGEYTNWYIDLKEPGQGGGGGFGGKRPFVPSWKDSREGAMFSAKTFAASYAKDIVCAMLNSAQLKPESAYIELMKGFKQILPLFELEKLQEPTPAQPETHAPTCKNLTTMLNEIKLIHNMQLFGKWWNDNQASIKVLSAGDKQILFVEKSHRSQEIENQDVDSGDIPF